MVSDGATRREKHINHARSLGGLGKYWRMDRKPILVHELLVGDRWIGLSRPGGENTTLEWSDGTPVDYPGSLYDGHGIFLL